MNARQFATAAPALCGTIVLAGWVVASLDGLGSASIENAGAMRIEDHRAPSPIAEAADASQVTATGNVAVAAADVAAAVESVVGTTTDATAAPDAPEPIVEAALPDSSQTLAPDTPSMQAATANTPDPVPNDAREAVSRIEILDECFVVDICVDRYLWALYQRTPKEDTNKVYERRKVTVRKRGKTVTVTRTFTRLVDADFTWKDPRAAERAGMPMMDYVIGGMDRRFKLKLFHTLHAAEQAGLSPGITSAFRDDYRQSIASGLKAASNRSYHGGSLRGGYGHGLAADIVSVKGTTRAQRWVASEALWKWVDVHGKEFGIGRPYLDRDPPHVAPMDGKEYIARRGTNVRQAEADMKKRTRLVMRYDRGISKRTKNARASKGRTI
ncbi:D-alanyl-D-alanine carboxypeptidase family protein [Bradyrhizobium sp. BRP22]|uniref:D-alanyl-D-alanine carboxypeptidase family protein n=1 Tax=Bradyrhizobium sp. BRP22 TaxID=2793821 RepID=UPI001CD548C4|nr:D-alanyl-D-alanine carboxypeptidase family protein [Bradyrhizobium sp. BRP22]